jgi:hypothetical protein
MPSTAPSQEARTLSLTGATFPCRGHASAVRGKIDLGIEGLPESAGPERCTTCSARTPERRRCGSGRSIDTSGRDPGGLLLSFGNTMAAARPASLPNLVRLTGRKACPRRGSSGSVRWRTGTPSSRIEVRQAPREKRVPRGARPSSTKSRSFDRSGRGLADHDQQHLEPLDRLQPVRDVGRHQDELTLDDPVGLAADGDLGHAVHHVDQRVEG